MVAPLVARRHGVDLRAVGDGNPGAWNALERLGPRRALPAFIGDGAKGAAAGLVGLALGGWWAAWAGVAGAMIGHALPLVARFRGGKAVMCLVGGALVLAPLPALVCLGLAAALALRWPRWGPRAALLALPAVQAFTGPAIRALAVLWLMGLVALLFGLDRVRTGRRAPATRAAGGRSRA
jgi:acyl phosphate:glycerol-3-phosphate acyltransferase